MQKILRACLLLFFLLTSGLAAAVNSSAISPKKAGYVAQINMDMLILPGTADFLETSIKRAAADGAKILVVHLDTPGGMLDSSQKMTQAIFDSKIPVVIYVNPSGSTATSAGVFITVSGHIAAMAPGTSIGAAHPVTGEGKDIEGDMRAKAENMASAMVKSIAEQRGRNADWVVEAVRKSSSLTETEALEKKVIDLIADDQVHLLQQLKGRKVKVGKNEIILEDYSSLPVQVFEPNVQQSMINFLANPNVAAILWLAATTGISIELYNPGLIVPGMVGVICLILALAVSQVIPVSYVGMSLIACGALLFGLELVVGSGILAVGGIISLVLGMIYLFDGANDPYLQVSLNYILPLAAAIGAYMLWSILELAKTRKNRVHTGTASMLDHQATVLNNFSIVQVGAEQQLEGRVFVNGENWKARLNSANQSVTKGEILKVIDFKDGYLILTKD